VILVGAQKTRNDNRDEDSKDCAHEVSDGNKNSVEN
jgi:hypothetical protein